MRLLRTLLTASILMLPALAAAQDVKIDFDKAFDFSTVKTYSISIGTKWGNDLSERRVLTEIDEEIAAKGWKKVDRQPEHPRRPARRHPDQAQRQHVLQRHGRLRLPRVRRGGMGTASTVVNEYTVGMLVVDMFDAKTKNLVFRGTAEDEISDNPDKNKRAPREGLDQDVQELSARGEEVTIRLIAIHRRGRCSTRDGLRGLAATAADFGGTGGNGAGHGRPRRGSFSKAAGSSNRWSSILRAGSRSR